MNKKIRLLALQNAVRYGKADPGKVIAKLIGDDPAVRSRIKELQPEIAAAVKEVNRMTPAGQLAELEQDAPELLEKKKQEKRDELKPLPGAEAGMVRVRIAPSPSGPLHIGHAYGTALNYEYAKMYGGSFFLRIEDTNPENIYPAAYDLIPDDVAWLTDNGIKDIIIQSSRLGLYYDHAEQLVQMGNAYACTCDPDQWRSMKEKGTACPCRSLPAKEHAIRYAKMFNEYAEGEAVLRLKTDIQHKNPAMRDFALMRIVEHVHPRTKTASRVWPLMVFSVAVDDHDMGITHVLNGKEHADNSLKENVIMRAFGWEIPADLHWGKINFEGFKLKTSLAKLAIERGEYTGWDDIRLPFLRSLRRRGYQPGAFRKFAVKIGLSLNDKHVTMEEFWKMIDAFNREIIEARAMRYFFIDNPVEVAIADAPRRDVELDLHPDNQKGGRRFSVHDRFYLAKDDVEKVREGELIRLMDCLNAVRKKEQGSGSFPAGSSPAFDFHSKEHAVFKEKGTRIMHWLPADGRHISVEVHLPDGSVKSGIGEETMRSLQAGDLVQLERFGYCRVDAVEKKGTAVKVVFWFTHR